MNEEERLIKSVGERDPSATEALLPIVYEHLRAIAGDFFNGQPRDHTLQPTALVHEAFLKIARRPSGAYVDQAHFCAVAARAMRQVLINHAEKRAARKRGGSRARIQLREELTISATDESLEHLLSLDIALSELAIHDPRKARVVEMRFFGGLTMDQIAHVLGVSLSTIESDWRLARAWLSRTLDDEGI